MAPTEPPSAKEREREFLTAVCSEAPRPRDVELRRAEDDDIGVVTADEVGLDVRKLLQRSAKMFFEVS